jgi:hypothetical protein
MDSTSHNPYSLRARHSGNRPGVSEAFQTEKEKRRNSAGDDQPELLFYRHLQPSLGFIMASAI